MTPNIDPALVGACIEHSWLRDLLGPLLYAFCAGWGFGNLAGGAIKLIWRCASRGRANP